MKAWIGKTKGNFPGTHDLLKLLEEVGEQAWASSKGMRKIRFGQHWKVTIKTLHAGDILCEWINALLRNEPHRDRGRPRKHRDLMNQATRDCLVTEYEPLIPALDLSDSGDRHVLAAVINWQRRRLT